MRWRLASEVNAREFNLKRLEVSTRGSDFGTLKVSGINLVLINEFPEFIRLDC